MAENQKQSSAEASAHVPSLVLNKSIYKLIHGSGWIGKFNTMVALAITKGVGSMWCAYIFTILSLISLPAAIKTHDPVVIIGWIAQTFLQLVLLPIIIVGQNVLAAASDARAEGDHQTLMAIHTLTTEVYDISQQQIKILELLEKNTKPAS